MSIVDIIDIFIYRYIYDIKRNVEMIRILIFFIQFYY